MSINSEAFLLSECGTVRSVSAATYGYTLIYRCYQKFTPVSSDTCYVSLFIRIFAYFTAATAATCPLQPL